MRFHGLDLNYLATLEVLLVERNLTRAAERLNLTQPAISNALTKLREHFKDRLLVRRGRHMERTAFAEQLLPPLLNTLQQIRGVTTARPRFEPATESRAYRVVTSDFIATVLIGEAILQIAKLAPHVVVEHLPLTDESVGKLARGEADALICPDGPNALVGFAKRPLFSENFVCIAGKDNKTVGKSLSMEELHRRPRLIPPYRMYYPETLGLRPEGVPVLAMPFTAIPWFVARSDYIALVPERLAKLYESVIPIRRVRLTKPIASVTFVALCHPSNLVDSFKVWLLDQIERVAQS